METLNVIGCGRVGKTLARLVAQGNVWRLGCVLNRSLASAERAVRFVGAGRAIENYDQLEPAGVVMISTSDEAIESCCRRLAKTGAVGKNTVVFHCSGALPSSILRLAAERGAAIASAHPVKSFAEPAVAVETFAGTHCALEGDLGACETLGSALERLGARVFSIDPSRKTIYHAATVLVCNYLTALMESGMRCFDAAGVPRQTAMEIIEPIVRETVDNLFRLGPAGALTGPIARGEVSVVAAQHSALGAWDPTVGRIYRALGRVAADLAVAQGTAPDDALETIREMLG